MREFKGKTEEEAVALAAEAVGKDPAKLNYILLKENKGFLGRIKEVVIGLPDIEDASEFAQEYLKSACSGLGVEIETTAEIDDEIIKITIDSERNPILIGKRGRTLQALNELVRLTVANKFKRRYRILLDVGGYKEERYSHLEYMARKTAHQVQRSHVDVKLDPMTPDERRIVHNVLNGMRNIKTESNGDGEERAVCIKYVSDGNERPQRKPRFIEEESKLDETEPLNEAVDNDIEEPEEE